MTHGIESPDGEGDALAGGKTPALDRSARFARSLHFGPHSYPLPIAPSSVPGLVLTRTHLGLGFDALGEGGEVSLVGLADHGGIVGLGVDIGEPLIRLL